MLWEAERRPARGLRPLVPDQKSFYVALSRAKEATVAIYTNDRAKLASAIAERTGEKQSALIPAASAALESQMAQPPQVGMSL